MIRRRPILFWILLVLFAAASVWWMMTVPRDLSRLYRAIPADAMLVGIHDNPASRWPEVALNPLTLGLLASCGVNSAEVRRLAADPETTRWVRKLASDRLVVAYTPSLGASGQPAWFFASWIGGRSQRLRWSLTWFNPSGVRRIGRGWPPVWTAPLPFIRPNLRLSFTVIEGVLLGCLSADPIGVRYMVAAADNAAFVPSVASERLVSEAAALWPPGVEDRGWVRLPLGDPPPLVGLALSSHTSRRSTGCVTMRHDLPPGPLLTETNLVAVERVIGDWPQLVWVFPPVYLAAGALSATPSVWAGVVTGLLASSPAGEGSPPCFLAMFGDEYSGRIRGLFGGDTNGPVKGLKIPAFVVGIPLRGGQDADPAVLAAVDRLNVACQWGLIPHRVAAGGYAATALDETRRCWYGGLGLDERAGYAIRGEWLLICSNMGTLTKLLERMQWGSGAVPPTESRWRRELASRPSTACGWMDLERAGKTLGDGVAACSLLLLIEDAPNTLRRRQTLAVVRAWCEGLRALDTCSLWLRPEGERATLEFRIGEGS